MPSLNIRKLDQEVYERLRVWAAQRGVSMEAEARRIITLAVMAPERLGALFLEAFGADNGVDLEGLARDPHLHPWPKGTAHRTVGVEHWAVHDRDVIPSCRERLLGEHDIEEAFV